MGVLQALVSLDSLPPQQLRAEFRQGVAALLELILAKVCVFVCVCVRVTARRRGAGAGVHVFHAWHVQPPSHWTKCRRPLQAPPCMCCPPAFVALLQSQPRPFGSLGVMTGPLLAGLAEAYVAAINAGAVPTIATAWQVRMLFGSVVRVGWGVAGRSGLRGDTAAA